MSPRPLLRLLVVADCAAWWIGVAATLIARAASRSAAGTGATTTDAGTARACSRIGAAALITPTAAAGASSADSLVIRIRCVGIRTCVVFHVCVEYSFQIARLVDETARLGQAQAPELHALKDGLLRQLRQHAR